MAKEVPCPTCETELLIQGDEVAGDDVFCVYCGGVYKVMNADVDKIEVEEDF